MKASAPMIKLLRCPSCQSEDLSEQGKDLKCGSCQQIFPSYGDIVWFFKAPEEAKREWQNRFNFYAQAIEIEALQLKTELKLDLHIDLTQKRMNKLLQAKIEHKREVLKIMEPIQSQAEGKVEHSIALKVKLPESQSLMSYYSNVLRDWSYGDVENQACLDLVLKTLGPNHKLGTLAVLGAGACRLPYDLHRQADSELTVAVDINPYLFYVAKRALSGKSFTLYEFPIAPIDLDSHAVKLKCKAPEPVKNDFCFLLADAMNPSFGSKAFDTILTPWLIDIVHQDAHDLFKRFNRILKPGGRWVNFGSLAFFHRQYRLCYSLEETLELVQKAGFEVERFYHEDIPYLHSPYSAQKRTEKVLCFSAIKVAEVEQPVEFNFLPEWALNFEAPIPLLSDFPQQASVNQTLAFIFALVDGKRSLRNIAEAAAPNLQLPVENVQTMLHGLFTKFFEDRLKGRQF